MNEYDLKKVLGKRSEKQNNNPAAPQGFNGIPNSVLTEVFAGKRKATNEMMGHRSDLAPSIAAKMNQAFGMDFSAVQVYQTDAMKGTGMQGMAQGNKVVLSSDVDLNTMEGQAILGHELSHIRAQSMGMGTGNGLLQDAALEHQADNEGLLAAHGQNIYGESMGMSMGLGMAGFEGLAPLSGGMSATAAAPMQAFWNPLKSLDKDIEEYGRINRKYAADKNSVSPKEIKRYNKIFDRLEKLETERDNLAEKHNKSLSVGNNGLPGVTLQKNLGKGLTAKEKERVLYLTEKLMKANALSSKPLGETAFDDEELADLSLSEEDYLHG